MADLRRVVESLGFDEVATYLQSGNVTFGADEPDREDLRKRLEQAIAARFGFEAPLILVSGPELTTVIEACPYRVEGDADPTKVHVTFFEPMPPNDALSKIQTASASPEEMAIGNGVVYMHLPNGMGRAILPGLVARATSKVVATTRNWRTVLALSEMLDA